jgi:trehalose/maltose transport system substrate-binding protein
MPMSTILHACLAAAAIGLAAAAAQAAGPLHLACSDLGEEQALCREEAAAWSRQTGQAVEVVSVPSDASERLALYQHVLAGDHAQLDVIQLDVAQAGLLGRYLLDLAPLVHGAERQHFPGLLEASRLEGRLVAMPWFADAGLLFYRQDLLDKYHLAPPQTWEQLQREAQAVQRGERAAGHARLWGYVWQGRPYEGLTCNALEWLQSWDAGSIIERDGRVTVDNPRAAEALGMAAAWVGRISPTAVLDFSEEESRGVFQAGNAVFMRNWPYAWAQAQAPGSPVRGKVGVTRLPAGPGPNGRHAAALGGQALAVTASSAHPREAAELVLYLTSAAVEKQRAIRGSYNPSVVALYDDADIRRSNPFMVSLRDVFAAAAVRPTSVVDGRYNAVSSEFYNAVHEVLSHTTEPRDAVARLAGRLRQLAREQP